MATEYVDHKDATTLEELIAAVAAMTENSDDHHPSTVIINHGLVCRLTLEEETLSDGSKVKNISVSFRSPDPRGC